MSGTPISWFARIIDLASDAIVATTTEVLTPAIGKRRGAAGTLSFGVRPGNAFIAAIITAWGGPTYQGPLQQYIVELSHDGGQTFISGMWLEKGRIVLSGTELGAVLDGDDFASGYDRTAIDHETFFAVPAGAILGAPPGQVPVGQNAGVILAGNFLPAYRRGFFDQSLVPSSLPGAHRLAFQVITDPFPAAQFINTDVNSDYLFRAALNVLQAAAGTLDPAHPELFGAQQSFAVDIPNRLLRMGYVGTTPAITLTNKKTPSQCNETIEAAIVEVQPTTIEPNLSAMFAQIELIGGTSAHNMPDGGKFTSIVIVNTNHGPESTGWRDSLPILGISTDNGGGGVFFWLHDGALHPMSGQMDVRWLAYDAPTNTIYAATPRGILKRTVGYDANPNELDARGRSGPGLH